MSSISIPVHAHQLENGIQASAEAELLALIRRLSEMGYDVSTQVCFTDEPAAEIVRLTKKHDVNSKRLGAVLLSRLEEIKKGHPSIGDVRGMGLFAAIELVKDRQTRVPLIPWTVEFYEKKHPLASQLLGRLKERGLYTYMRWNILMICPPLCITEEELAWGLDRIDDALSLADEYVASVKVDDLIE